MSRVYAHFIGVGGAGMSGLAKVLNDRGVPVTGSDMRLSRYAAALREDGVTVHIGHDAANLGNPEVVVVSTAIPETNPELVEARSRGLEVWPRARMLAALAGDLKTVAVAGTHGKTTTSSMATAALMALGADPTFLIGGELNDVGSNARCGAGEHYVVEADESDGSFLFLDPFCAIVTNVEADHMDHYGSFQEIVEVFEAFLARVDPAGVAVLCGDDPVLPGIAHTCRARIVTYGRGETSDVRMTACSPDGHGMRFTVEFPGGTRVEGSTSLPGEHMALNATGVLAAVWALGMDLERAVAGIASFGGVKRRFEPVGSHDGVDVVDDYAHHPTEVRATLTAAKSAGYERVWVVFQPHRYSRTAAFTKDFGAAFDHADRVVLMDVYSAGEAPIPGVSGKTVLDSMLARAPRKAAAYFPHRVDIAGYIAQRARAGDLVMTMGAGDVTTVGPEIMRALTEREPAGGPSCP
ncbi:MAG: UDP-N-acetylmuramate--L-alanine ligase [Coriobacteriia bacterium]|nr:UDP-N-acetylmuramate--L-alanine ligase [Coriobacteriia bacterium]